MLQCSLQLNCLLATSARPVRRGSMLDLEGYGPLAAMQRSRSAGSLMHVCVNHPIANVGDCKG